MAESAQGNNTNAPPKRHPLVIEGEVELIGPRREMARVRDSVIYSDESKQAGGEGTAPSPLEYFVSTILF